MVEQFLGSIISRLRRGKRQTIPKPEGAETTRILNPEREQARQKLLAMWSKWEEANLYRDRTARVCMGHLSERTVGIKGLVGDKEFIGSHKLLEMLPLDYSNPFNVSVGLDPETTDIFFVIIKQGIYTIRANMGYSSGMAIIDGVSIYKDDKEETVNDTSPTMRAYLPSVINLVEQINNNRQLSNPLGV